MKSSKPTKKSRYNVIKLTMPEIPEVDFEKGTKEEDFKTMCEKAIFRQIYQPVPFDNAFYNQHKDVIETPEELRKNI